jgi:hypothetical protein
MTVKEMNRLIAKYKHTRFAKGKSFDLNFLVKHMDITPLPTSFSRVEAAKFNASVVKAYTSLNKLLAHRGLYIKAENYYSNFKIISEPTKKVADYRLKAETNKKAADNLSNGIYSYGSSWSKSLNKAEQQRVQSHVYRPTFAINRY